TPTVTTQPAMRHGRLRRGRAPRGLLPPPPPPKPLPLPRRDRVPDGRGSTASTMRGVFTVPRGLAMCSPERTRGAGPAQKWQNARLGRDPPRAAVASVVAPAGDEYAVRHDRHAVPEALHPFAVVIEDHELDPVALRHQAVPHLHLPVDH